MDIKQLKQLTKDLNVLYIEDDDILRNSTKELFKLYFLDVEEAVDGKDGFMKYKNYYDKNGFHYDIIITDLRMPKLDGEKLSELILNFNPSQEIIIISAYADFSDIVKLLNIGVKKFLSKPINTQELYQVMYDVAQNIRKSRINQTEADELREYNEILKIREKEKITSLKEFSDALNISAIVAKTDTNGVITYVNQEFCNVCGYSEDELIGKNNKILNSGNKVKNYYQPLWTTINNKEVYKHLFENRHKDGSLYYIETTINPILDVNGNIIEFIAVSHNMTQLMQSLEASKKAQIAKDEFLAIMSHEIRTPLNAILGFITVLKKIVKGEEPTSYLNIIDTSSKSLLSIINDILDFSKLKSGNFIIDKTEVHTVKELSDAISLFASKADEKNLSYTIHISENVPKSMSVDIFRVKQILSNLLSNAIKFTPMNGKINISVRYEDSSIIIAIKDSGIGIEKENFDKIFSAFFQADTSATRKYGGTGLGLSISKTLTELMQGSLSVDSVKNEGSTFTLEIPVIPKVMGTDNSNNSKAIPVMKKESNDSITFEGKILIVEDDKTNQLLIKVYLKGYGIDFKLANDGEEAVTMFQAEKYDLVLMDENMPNMSGTEAMKEIKSYEKENSLLPTPIVVLTANALDSDRERFLKAGMDGFMAKPINRKELESVFSKYLKRR